MARRGSSRRTYVRDANGRFASTPGGSGPKRPATKAVKRGPNRLIRDNAGKITSQGGDGATVRGGRLKTAAGNLRGRQVAKLKTMQGVSYGKGANKATKIHPRISNRSAADQTHRDKTAKQWKSVEKSARRAVASARAAIGGPDRIPAYPRLTSARKIKGESRFLREQIYEQSSRLMRSPLRGKNKLTAKDRAGIVSDMVSAARSLKARSAMITPRSETLKTRAPRTPNTIAKPKGLKPGALAGKIRPRDAAKRASELRKRAASLDKSGTGLMTGGRKDRAAVNVGLGSRSRRNETSAGFRGLEMSRQAQRLRNKADRIEQRAAQSSAKALKKAAGIKSPKKQEIPVSKSARIAAGEISTKNDQAKRGEKRLTTLFARRLNSSNAKRLKADETKQKAMSFYNTKGRTWRERKP